MSKNVKTYTLLGLVLLIWGIIGFKVVGALSPKPLPEDAPVSMTKLPMLKKERDTFSIMANYRDPFLGTMPPIKKEAVKKSIPKTKVPKKNIVYSGLVSKSGSGSTLYFVTIDGQQFLMSRNEVVNDVRLLNGDQETIKVSYGGTTEIVNRSQ